MRVILLKNDNNIPIIHLELVADAPDQGFLLNRKWLAALRFVFTDLNAFTTAF